MIIRLWRVRNEEEQQKVLIKFFLEEEEERLHETNKCNNTTFSNPEHKCKKWEVNTDSGEPVDGGP